MRKADSVMSIVRSPPAGRSRLIAWWAAGLVALAGCLILMRTAYWRGTGAGVPFQEPMFYTDQYVYPRAWTRAQLAPGVPDPTPLRAVYGPNTLSQQFRSCCNHLAMLRIWMGTANGQRVIVRLVGPSPDQTIYAAEMRLERDGYQTFAFPPLAGSAGQVYRLTVQAPDAGPKDAVTMRVIPTERVGGLPFLNEYSSSGNLDFASYHRASHLSWPTGVLKEQVFPQVTATRLQQYKPKLFKGNAFWGLLLGTVLVSVVWLALAWFRGARRSWLRRIALLAAVLLLLGMALTVLSGAATWPNRSVPMQANMESPAAPLGGQRLVHDLLLDAATAGRRPEPRFVSTVWRAAGTEQQPCLSVPAESEVRYGLRVPPDARLHVNIALEGMGAERRFEISAGGDLLFEQVVRGPGAVYAEVDLAPYSGQRTTLSLHTSGEGQEDTPGLWCAPQIESAHTWLLPYPIPETIEVSLQRATFGDQVALLGAHLETTRPQAGGAVAVTLYWHALRRAAQNYTVFVHLQDSQGALCAQGDSEPVRGIYPIEIWTPGQVIVDQHDLALPADLPDGTYTIAVGWYDAATWERLPARDAAGTLLADGRVQIETPLTLGE